MKLRISRPGSTTTHGECYIVHFSTMLCTVVIYSIKSAHPLCVVIYTVHTAEYNAVYRCYTLNQQAHSVE